MEKPPFCEEIGIKKGPWTPEEDIILVSYIQQHGPRNWKSVPTNTGLMRCSKSCRLRWTNYLRPGIKRGNFTPHEERMIIHLQGLLGNRWAAIASYLSQRTDNDIKNYWNTHLKKKMKKATDSSTSSTNSSTAFHLEPATDNCSWRNVAEIPMINTSSTYASSTENIARLLKGWTKPTTNTDTGLKPQQQQSNTFNVPHEQVDPRQSFENLGSSSSWNNSSSDIRLFHGIQSVIADANEAKQRMESVDGTLSPLETWLLDEATGQMESLMEHWEESNKNDAFFE